MTCLQELFFRPVSSEALLQTHFFKCILLDASKLQIKFLYSWTCSIRIFMDSTLIMDPVHLNKLFSISNWLYFNTLLLSKLNRWLVKHPLFQHGYVWLSSITWTICSRDFINLTTSLFNNKSPWQKKNDRYHKFNIKLLAYKAYTNNLLLGIIHNSWVSKLK